jgi:oligopeptide/dipeptide ABC transporter ATP-binding protein
MCDRVAVMYAGRVVEEAPVLALFDKPLHPYTEGLLASIPRLDANPETLPTIEGSVSDPIRPEPGCAFAPRCAYVLPVCREAAPELRLIAPGRSAACVLADQRL